MMGDNRHQLDSRVWGFVPKDHIVGKPIFIWFSIDGINDGIKIGKLDGIEFLLQLMVRRKSVLFSLFYCNYSFLAAYNFY